MRRPLALAGPSGARHTSQEVTMDRETARGKAARHKAKILMSQRLLSINTDQNDTQHAFSSRRGSCNRDHGGGHEAGSAIGWLAVLHSKVCISALWAHNSADDSEKR